MTDRLEEALAALRDATAPEDDAGEATLARIRRSLAASDDASERALEAALTPLADVAVLYGEGDRLLDLAAGALREQASAEPDGAETLERIRRSLAARDGAPATPEAQEGGEGLVDLAVAGWRAETAPAQPARDAAPETQTRVLATLDARRARARWALAAAAALALAVLPPTAWAWSTGRFERWFGSVAAPSEPSSASRDPEPQAPSPPPPPRERAPRVAPPPVRDVPEASVIVASSSAADDERASPRPAPRRPPRRGVAHDAPPEAHRADPPVVAAAEPRATAEEPALPSPEESGRPPAGAEERELFARAHHLHFGGAPHVAALAAWDDYLSAYPRGHYAPEARYNRALTLVRLGRIEEARRVLARFAAAPAGAYRRAEARALLDAMGASATGE